MPVNFKTTFEQPLLQAFDNGQIFSGDDIAQYITQYYVSTIKTGIGPIGTPPNPYLTADTRARLMQDIISLYYQAKDIDLLQSNIGDTIENINNLTQKGAKLQQEITAVVRDVSQTAQEIALLPVEFIRLVESLIKFIKDAIDRVNILVTQQVVTLFDTVPFVNDEAFINSFEKYRVKLETIRDFPTTIQNIFSDITPFNAVDKINQFVQLPTFVTSLYTDAKNDFTSVGLLVADIGKKLEIAFIEILNIVRAIINPQDAIALLENLASSNTSLRTVLDKLKRFQERSDFLNKKLSKLNKKRDELFERVEREVNSRIEKYQKVVEDKAKELQAKISKALSTESKIKFIAETTKSVNDEIQRINKKIGPVVREIVKTLDRAQRIVVLVQQLVSLINDIQTEIISFVNQIQAQATKTKQLFEELGSLYQNEYQNVLNLLEQEQQSFQLTATTLENLVSQTPNPAEGANSLAIAAQEIKTNTERLIANFNRRGLSRYLTIVSAPILAGSATYFDMEQFLEFNSRKYNSIYTRAQVIVNSILDLYDEIKADIDKKPYVRQNRKVESVRDNALSTNELFKKLDKLFVKVDKVRELIQKKILELQELIQKYIDLAIKKAEEFFNRLLKPVTSFIDDKKEEINGKFNDIQAKLLEKKQLVYYSLAAGYAGLAAKDLAQFIANVVQGDYKYNSNEKLLRNGFNNYLQINRYIKKATAFEKITPQQFQNGFEGILVGAASGTTSTLPNLTTQEQADKQKFDKILEYLRQLDSVITIVLNIGNELQNNGEVIINQLRLSFANNATINAVRQTIIDIIELLRKFKTPLQLISFIKNIELKQFKLSGVATYLVSIEETFFGRDVKDAINSLGLKNEIPDSIILYVLEKLQTVYNKIITTAENFIQTKLEEVKDRIATKIEKAQEKAKKALETQIKKKADIDGKLLTAALYSSLVAFWAGATWNNPAGDIVIVTSPGSVPPPLNTPAEGGSSNYVSEITKALELHLKTIGGTYIQQTPQGPVTIPWIGYN